MVIDVIIAFYPGAGGNRYYRMLNQLEWKQTDRSYDLENNQLYENRYLLGASDSSGTHILTHALNHQQINNAFPGRPITYIHGSLRKCLRREWKLAGHDRYMQKINKRSICRIEHYNCYKDNSWPIINSIAQLEELPPDILQEVNLNFAQLNHKPDPINIDLNYIVQNLSFKAESAYEIINWHAQYYHQYPVSLTENNSKVINIEHEDSEFADLMRRELDSYHSNVFDTVWEAIYDNS